MIMLNFCTDWWSDPTFAALLALVSCKNYIHLRLMQTMSVSLKGHPYNDHHVFLWICWCWKYVFLRRLLLWSQNDTSCLALLLRLLDRPRSHYPFGHGSPQSRHSDHNLEHHRCYCGATRVICLLSHHLRCLSVHIYAQLTFWYVHRWNRLRWSSRWWVSSRWVLSLLFVLDQSKSAFLLHVQDYLAVTDHSVISCPSSLTDTQHVQLVIFESPH